jgi:AcrR family transcriptional regulator
VARQRPLVAELQRRRDRPVHRAHPDRERARHGARVAADVDPEQGPARDRQRHLHHLVGQVDPVARAPSRDLLAGLGDHHLAVARQPPRRERRREQLAVLAVQLALGGEQPVAEQRPQELDAGALLEARRLRHQHLVRQIAAGHEVERDVGERDSRDRPEARRRVLQREPVAPERDQVAQERQAGHRGDAVDDRGSDERTRQGGHHFLKCERSLTLPTRVRGRRGSASTMQRQVRTTPRKRPRQERSRATVDTILEATARVLVKHGFDGLTTNLVAQTAGVSVGSLYQYFPNKSALVAALIENHVDHMTSLCLAELGRVAQLPMAEAIRSVIEVMIRAHAVQPELHRVLTEQVPRVGRMGRLREIEALVERVVAGLLAARKAELAIDDPEMAAFVLVSAIEAVTHRAALLSPEMLHDPRLPRLVDETCAMVRRYLGVADG